MTCLLAIDCSTEAMCLALSRAGETLVVESEGADLVAEVRAP